MTRLLAFVSALALSCAAASPVAALSTKECSAKYQAAKQAGTLGSMKWNDFRKAECGAAPDVAPTTVQNPLAPSAKTAAPPASAPSPAATAAKPAPSPRTAAAKPAPAPAPIPSAASGSAVFPSAIDPKYSSLSAGKARQKTCLDQYNTNKAAGGTGNGGLNWIQKGGGYYSECNKRLKA
jgi:pyruvate/2-oxoglutarate dehydrogenase complex dihydrolipoamide acyltransferase (E2) component